MPWNSNGGTGGKGGSWKPGNPGPWGQGPGGGRQPDLNDLWQRIKDRLGMMSPGGGIGAPGVLIGQSLGGVVFGILAVITAFQLTRRLRPGAGPASDMPVPALTAKAALVGMAELTREEADREIAARRNSAA